MICQECGREASGSARGWRGYVEEYVAGDSTGDIIFYCPDCALREFGPLRLKNADGDEAPQG